jgi:hypothetical protein
MTGLEKRHGGGAAHLTGKGDAAGRRVTTRLGSAILIAGERGSVRWR